MSNIVPPDPEKIRLFYELALDVFRPKCSECGQEATQVIDLVDEYGNDAGKKYFCDKHYSDSGD